MSLLSTRHLEERPSSGPKPLNSEDSGHFSGAIGKGERKPTLSQVTGIGRGRRDFLASSRNFVPAFFFALTGALGRFYFPGGTVLLSRADDRRTQSHQCPRIKGHAKVQDTSETVKAVTEL